MYYLKNFAVKISLKDQMPSNSVIARDDRIFIDFPNIRLGLYGRPDNRACFANKITGINTINRFGYNGTLRCNKYYIEMLNAIGVDTTSLDV